MSLSSNNGAPALLDARGLRVSYGPIAAVKGIDFHVQSGEVVALLGPNGAGKSSTLRAILASARSVEGQLEFDGRSLIGARPELPPRLGIAVAPEGRRLFSSLTVKENLQLGAYRRRDRHQIDEDIARMFEHFPVLGERAGGAAGNLSGGEQQMLAVARALMARPRMLLLDEPSLGLAPRVVGEVFRALSGLKREGMTMLLIEQNALRALRLADRAYIMANGRLVKEGIAADMCRSADLLEHYLGSATPEDGCNV